jgi:hypothetical protein
VYAPLPTLLPVLKCVLEVMICEGVQHCLHLRQNRGFELLFWIRETEKRMVRSGWQLCCCFWSNIPGQKRKCEMVCCDATASASVAKVQDEVFAHLPAVAVKVTVLCKIGCSVCQDEFYVNNPHDVKQMMSMFLTLLLVCLALFFRSRWF